MGKRFPGREIRSVGLGVMVRISLCEQSLGELRNRPNLCYSALQPAADSIELTVWLSVVRETRLGDARGGRTARMVFRPSNRTPFRGLYWFMPRRPSSPARGRPRKRAKSRTRSKKRDPIFVDGQRPRPMYVDYKDVDLLKKLINRHGRIVGRRKTGCSAVSQHAVTQAIKRARFMALLPYVGE